jgi:NitT/TauT family transport system ATP-binding protein
MLVSYGRREAQEVIAEPRSSAVALEINEVSHRYEQRGRPSTWVLDRITFNVAREEFVVVMGPSGCGKSTLLSLIAGFEFPSRGTIRRDGAPVAGPGADRGMVFQKAALYPWLSVVQNVEFGLKARGQGARARELAMNALREVGLEDFAKHRPYELSGGMQHRAALARTLVNGPEVLLMDEPFAALDAQTRGDMQALLLDVWQRHRSAVVFVTHDIEEGLLLADRAIVLSRAPARIVTVLDVDFPRPRPYETILESDFVALRGEVRSLLQHTRSSH